MDHEEIRVKLLKENIDWWIFNPPPPSVAKCRGSWVVGRGRGSWVWVVDVGVGVGKCRG